MTHRQSDGHTQTFEDVDSKQILGINFYEHVGVVLRDLAFLQPIIEKGFTSLLLTSASNKDIYINVKISTKLLPCLSKENNNNKMKKYISRLGPK